MPLSRRHFLAGTGAAALSACATGGRAGAGSGEFLDAVATAALIREGRLSSLEAVNAAIARAERAQPQLNFLVADLYDAARTRAAAPPAGPLSGVPYLIKDLNDAVGAPTRSGSRSTAGARPATAEDAYVRATHAAGLVTIGKSSTPEFGYLPTTEPLAFGPTRNPWNTGHSSGGSSGGAAAAVAAGVVPMAHANDGGGSIRFPACNCGLFGLKPSRGRMASDQPGARPLEISVQGCVSRTVRDTALLFSLTEETGPAAPLPRVGLVTRPLARPLRVGVLTRTFQGLDPDPEVGGVVTAAGRLLQSLGHAVDETRWPVAQEFPDDFLAFWSYGALLDRQAAEQRAGRKADETLLEPFSLVMAENAARLAPEAFQAVQGRLVAAAAAYDAWMKGFDVVVSPVIGAPARPLGYFRGDVPFAELRERLLRDVGYTLIHNVSGAPAMSLPLGMSRDSRPIGVQVGGAWGADGLLLELALQVEEAAPWIDRRPPVWTL